MVSLWGSKTNGEDHDIQDEEQEQRGAPSSQVQQSRQSEDVNERTRLIPRHDQAPGYLSPDDPAVSASKVFIHAYN